MISNALYEVSGTEVGKLERCPYFTLTYLTLLKSQIYQGTSAYNKSLFLSYFFKVP